MPHSDLVQKGCQETSAEAMCLSSAGSDPQNYFLLWKAHYHSPYRISNLAKGMKKRINLTAYYWFDWRSMEILLDYANISPSSSNIEIRLTCHLSTVAVCEMLQCANWLRFITAEQSDLSSKVFQGCRPFTLPRLLHKCKLFQLLEKRWTSYSCLNWNKKMFCSYFSHKSETIAEIQHMTNKDHMIWGWGGWQGTVTLPEGQHKEDKYFNIERKLYDEERMWSGKRFGSRELGLQERKGMTWQRGLRRDFQMEQYRWVKARAPNCSWSCLQPLNWYSSPSTPW